MTDGQLTLVEPSLAQVNEVLAACGHPATLSEAPDMARVTRAGLTQFLNAAPAGHHSGQLDRDPAPAYHFWMRLADAADADGRPIRMAGGINLRLGRTPNLLRYIGHVGYNVYPAARGRHLAERAARLLLPLARRHGMAELWITCNPDNAASHRTIQRLGGRYVDTVDLPRTHELYARGERQKCRYRVEL